MTKREAQRQNQQADTLQSLGFTYGEAEALRRISLTLRRWFEHECNGNIERDEERGNKPFWSNPNSGKHYIAPAVDREAGALKRLQGIIDARKARGVNPENMRDGDITAYVQTDCRGVALYILRPGDVPDGADVSAYYNRGIAVY